MYREIEHPKLRNLKKAAFVIFLYSLILTSLVSFFAVMLIPDPLRKNHYSNLMGGLAMYLKGPFELRLMFHFFVVLVGVLILAGAAYTSTAVRITSKPTFPECSPQAMCGTAQ